ncbi:Zinc transporter 6 [Acorus calamus]|uniref:Zinc transporter 6 n=1 Tax=Acorus calamus TaxID=4465 RepID=A0AAV9C417_ACOCL|nr:Zinc transporter 6 [Acorus calamus]
MNIDHDFPKLGRIQLGHDYVDVRDVLGHDSDRDYPGHADLPPDGYDDRSMNALISEGLLGSLSSGILIYMALINLIVADFFHDKTMSSKPWLKKASYTAVVLGSVSMSVLAFWA